MIGTLLGWLRELVFYLPSHMWQRAEMLRIAHDNEEWRKERNQSIPTTLWVI